MGIEHMKAASVAIILHLVIFAPATFFGLYYLVKEGLSLENLKDIGEKQAEEVEHSQETREFTAPQPPSEMAKQEQERMAAL
jgi:hypothetical protein